MQTLPAVGMRHRLWPVVCFALSSLSEQRRLSESSERPQRALASASPLLGDSDRDLDWQMIIGFQVYCYIPVASDWSLSIDTMYR